MPWTCKTCQLKIPDDQQDCPTCSMAKSSWTVVGDATRTFVISRPKLVLKRGTGHTTTASDQPIDVALIPANVARALPKSVASEIAARGHLPATRDVLFVCVCPASHPDWTLSLAVDYAQDELEELTFPQDGVDLVQGQFVAKFLFVYGEGELDAEFGDIQVVDLSEAGERGHAPDLEVSGVGKGPLELPVEAVVPGPFVEIELVDDAGEPVAGEAFRIQLADDTVVEGTLDQTGRARVEPVPVGACQVSFPALDSSLWDLDG